MLSLSSTVFNSLLRCSAPHGRLTGHLPLGRLPRAMACLGIFSKDLVILLLMQVWQLWEVGPKYAPLKTWGTWGLKLWDGMGLFNIMMGKAKSKLGFDIRLGIWNYEPRINAGCWNPAISNIWWPKVPAWSVPYPVPLKHHMYTIPGSFVIYALCAWMVLYTNDQRLLLQRALNYTSRHPCQHSSKCILMTCEHKLEHVGMHTEPCGHGAKLKA